MCMNLMIAGVLPDKKPELDAFMYAMAPKLASSNRDGIGYAAMTPDGIYGERWLRPEEVFKYRKKWSEKDQEIKNMFHGILDADPRYNYFVQNEKVSEYAKTQAPFAVIMHARMATVGARDIKNVHPFMNNGIALIHNGGISNHDQKHLKKLYSSCDSEVILNNYIEHDVANKPDRIQAVAEDISGGYACGVLAHDEEGAPIMDLFRNSPSLWAMHVNPLNAMVFCTSSLAVIEAIRELKAKQEDKAWSIGSIFRFKDDKMLRLDARTGRFLSFHSFQPLTWYEHNERDRRGNGGSSNSNGGNSIVSGSTTPGFPPADACDFGPANRPRILGAEATDPNNDDTTTVGDAQEAIELVRAIAAEKKTGFQLASPTKVLLERRSRTSPRVLEQRRAEAMNKPPKSIATSTNLTSPLPQPTGKDSAASKGLDDKGELTLEAKERMLH